jgi:hypothetical protein
VPGKDNWWDNLPRPEWSAFHRIEQEQDWFEVYRIEDGIFAIYESGQFEEVISFLVTGDDRALLFDTGLGIGDIKRVVQQLTAAYRSRDHRAQFAHALRSHRRQLPVRNDLRS